ncbi:glutamate synthase-related protein [Marinicella litoralis]|uniref:Glutamate synthase domain-containing protein 2 n=1 Tax=Marinicella litoralis TaxID=644220 RepID=A0A4V3DIJ3_9GAMM|nr:glutamate synthase-related protein [Marinicella litoralis]TDR22361.1 glutamate synthase domain-containing protein 2 [Marinicella litoralis]
MSNNNKITITPLKNGPLRVENLNDFAGADGEIKTTQTMALCRCGQSKNKPFCDGSHVEAGFIDERGENKDDKRLVFKGDPITIYENVAICSHAGYCPSGKPDKWRPKTAHGGFTDFELIEKIRKCPSGALSYAHGDTEYRDQKRPAKVTVAKDGPFNIVGGIELRNTQWGEGASKEHYSLCRCGASKMKPFCDGSHDDVWKNGEDGFKAKNKVVAAKPSKLEPHVALIHQMAKEGVEGLGEEGPLTAMGAPRTELPSWDHIQIMTAQLNPRPLTEGDAVNSSLIIGPKARKPLHLSMPLFVSDMSFGALSEETKTALAKGAQMVETGICSGEGGMLPEEQANNQRYLYELGSGRIGYKDEILDRIQAFHFKAGQAAKTGIGGHLPGNKVTEKIAEVRNIEVGSDSVSPATFDDLETPADFKNFADHVRQRTGGIPVGFKISANRIEQTIDFALEASADYIILDGRGGGTGAAPALFRDHISVPTIPALARARRHLDRCGVGRDVTLIITGGLRVPADFIKAMAMGADGIALANASIQAVGCVGARICNTNQCPAGIATQDPELRALIKVDEASLRVANFYQSAVAMMKVMAKACGHDDLNQFCSEDIATWHRDMALLSGINYSGVSDL